MRVGELGKMLVIGHVPHARNEIILWMLHDSALVAVGLIDRWIWYETFSGEMALGWVCDIGNCLEAIAVAQTVNTTNYNRNGVCGTTVLTVQSGYSS